MVKKCIEVNFEEKEFCEWANSVEQWDMFVAENVEQTHFYYKLNESDQEDEPTGIPKQSGESWTLMQASGQKHAERIRKLNMVKKTEAFDERYEETRVEREDRLNEASKRR